VAAAAAAHDDDDVDDDDGSHNCSSLTFKISPTLTLKFMILLTCLFFVLF